MQISTKSEDMKTMEDTKDLEITEKDIIDLKTTNQIEEHGG